MIGLTKKYGKLTATTQYASVPLETLERVNYCMDGRKSSFGLEDPDGGIWILDPKTMLASHYWTNKPDHIVAYDNWTDFELLVTRLLFTHQVFCGPHLVYRFLLACKELSKIEDNEHT